MWIADRNNLRDRPATHHEQNAGTRASSSDRSKTLTMQDDEMVAIDESSSAKSPRSISERLDHERRSLLDLSNRNSLLNFRRQRAAGVQVVDATCEDVFRRLVIETRKFTFRHDPEAENPENQENPEARVDLTGEIVSSQPGVKRRSSQNSLQTPYSSTELARRMRRTHSRARTALEETGVNVLFMALGALEWYESDSSKLARRAPLVLVPVTLDQSDVRGDFRIYYSDEDFGTNLSLREKLEQEFGINLPELPGIEEIDVLSYFRDVEKVISKQTRWEVDDTAIDLNFFSFTRYMMYQDLGSDNWPDDDQPADHPVMTAILGDGFSSNSELSGIQLVAPEELDRKFAPGKPSVIMDADGSQLLAIIEANSGINLVIQGPPGTGKSQTIANILAEAIEQDKKVLFVSEKMAALEVVKSRLDAVGLGVACLELHSNKARKTEVLADLKNTFALGEPINSEIRSTTQLIANDRQRLNEYCLAVNTPIGNSGVTPVQAYGRTMQINSELKDTVVGKLEIKGASNWDAVDRNRKLSLVEDLDKHLTEHGAPSDNPLNKSRTLQALLPNQFRMISTAWQKFSSSMNVLTNDAKQLAESLELPGPNTVSKVGRLIDLCHILLESPDTSGLSPSSDAWREHAASMSDLIDGGKSLTASVSDKSVLWNYRDYDVNELREVESNYTRHGGRLWSFLFKDYRNAKRRVAGIFEMPDKFKYEDAVTQLGDVISFKEIYDDVASQESVLQDIVVDYSSPIEVDWDAVDGLDKYLRWARQPQNADRLVISTERLETVKKSESVLKEIETSVKELKDSYDDILSGFELEHHDDLRFSNNASVSLVKLHDTVSNWHKGGLQACRSIAFFNRSAGQLRDEGLDSVVECAWNWDSSLSSLRSLMEYHIYDDLVDTALKERSSLREFDRSRHGRAIERFRKNDLVLMDMTKSEVSRRHWDGIPRSGAGGEMVFLKNEMAKKRRILPIRRLLERAGRAVQSIKPIFMMSPLSVATYLTPGNIKFDMVVFDEASQVKPVDAFGAILRGDSAVVVGDSRQLPPTSFFDRVSEETDEDDFDQNTSDLESVLDLFVARGAREKTLQWHYRSQHESLIAVSNKEFYQDQLLVAPSPDSSMTDLGVQFRHLPHTHYTKGGRNAGEALEVAKAVMDHARKYPHLSLGVAAFGKSQADVIEDEVYRLIRGDKSMNVDFFSRHPEEPFFVKNLENVQGDERDVIFISVGYGRQADGVLRMNFGPLNTQGGERRMNVLITRAKRRCVVFSNITSGDIDLSKTDARGVRALKTYLEFAETGRLESPEATGMSADSPFEEWVARELISRGYRVDEQVGTGQYRIDLAVVDDKKPGHYLLGIECDGASYHSSKTARDRDRIRQDTLESKGWKIHRIWSTDWFYSPKEEMDRLVSVIEDTKTDRDSNVKHANSIGNHTRAVTIQRKKPSEGVSNVSSVPYKLWNSEERTHMPLRSYNSRLSSEYSGMVFYYETEMIDVVRVEGPVHISEVRRRVSDATGERITARDDDMVRSYAERSKQLGIKDDFLYMSGSNSTVVRDRSELPSRSKNIDLIAPEELQLAIRQVVKESIGIHVDELPRAVCSMLGLGSTTEKRRKAIFEHLELMKRRRRVVERNGVLELVSRGR